MKLDLRFSNRPLEDLWCEAVVFLFFRGPHLAKGVLSGLNQKMVGLPARLERSGFLTGSEEEMLLLAGQDMTRADKVLLAGLGDPVRDAGRVIASCAGRAAHALNRMGIREFGVYIPLTDLEGNASSECLEESVYQLTAPFQETHGDAAEFLLKIFLCIDPSMELDPGPIAQRLRDNLDSFSGISIALDLQDRTER